ncbi:MAG TPA: flagellar hook-length control protein FliK [Dissulfurispiraceae bacterium]|nr:flagellar hook-length control protein FliK [Dissulfurispiraceae bacterium]
MINFKIISFDNGVLSLEKSGKPLQFKVGEVVSANVLENLPSGSIELKIKGSVVTAQTSIPMEKDSTAYFKVTSLPVDGQQLTLKYLGSEPKGQGLDTKSQALASLMKSLSAAVSSGSEKVDSALIQNLIKSLPADVSDIPRDVRMQLQSLLTDSLKSAGQSISSRLDAVLGQLLPKSSEGTAGQQSPLKNGLMLDIERLMAGALKTSLVNTGVAFEAKLRAEALSSLLKTLPFQQTDADLPTAAQGGKSTAAPDSIRHDLKALLLGLKAAMAEGQIDGSVKAGTGLHGEGMKAAQQTLAQQVNGLLKDVETFQLLSKTTESFYTFLPLDWKQLRDGDIALKKEGRAGMRGGLSTCRINLNLDRYGRISVLVMKNGADYAVSFWAEDPALKARMTEHAEDLKKTFRQSGLSLLSVQVLDVPDAIHNQFNRIDAPETMVSVKA